MVAGIIFAILLFGFLITSHELGHFLAAKAAGVEVTDFSVGMGPVLFSKKIKTTRYCLRLFPIGGSCSMYGEDEEIDKPGSFYHAKSLARLGILAAGAGMNILTAVLAGIVLCFLAGVDRPVVSDVEEGHPAAAVLEEGDRITRINDVPISCGKDLTMCTLSGMPETVFVTYVRDGVSHTDTYETTVSSLLLGFSYQMAGSTELTAVTEGGVMAEAGFLPGDVIVSVDGHAMENGAAVHDWFTVHPLSEGVAVDVVCERDGAEISASVMPRMTENTSFGFSMQRQDDAGFLSYIAGGISEAVWWVKSVFVSLQMLFTGDAGISDLTGPVGITSTVAETVSSGYDLREKVLSGLMITVMLGANLGVMNLLPIPALDGGRIVFTLIEMIRRKPVPRQIEAVIHAVGMIVLLGLIFVVFVQDSLRLMG